jgi:post-segregation antitoxin (ccd killing protein)
MKTRKCTRCGEEKPETAEYFHRDKNRRGGLYTICKECRNKACRRWRAENPEKAREAVRRWQAENPEKMREAVRRWKAENPEKVRESNRRWKAKNPEKQREAEKRWQAENPEKVREAGIRWRNTLAPAYLKNLISAKYDIDRSEIGDELIKAKRREMTYYRQLTHLKNQQNETK